ncbi:hypothetical protein [Morganella sp. EGD-HP17]|uniref:hypothetical protein n=1 Tax=Morganella sp. EGD-HP17 TaxID=1435146 RepID=UPI00044559F7|nr:hypothetical protein [Morganella sp. EGD-HP17]ETO43455.1 hypothetical protein X965_15700 [Morganella sp. EGD-HP17]
MLDFLLKMFDFLHPENVQELCKFYLFLSLFYLLIHLAWEHFDKSVENFSLKRLPQKMDIIYAAATFATSVFLIIILMDLGNPLRTDDVMALPFTLAGLTGLCSSLGSLQPQRKAVITPIQPAANQDKKAS